MTPDPYPVAALGLAVFPLVAGGKTVRGPGWQTTATTDPDLIAATWPDGANIGVGCWRSGILGIDLDVKDGIDGIARFAALCERHGDVWPQTLTVRTPSQGLHLYLAVQPGQLIGSTIGSSNSSPLGPGIDTRGPGRGTPPLGGYLVGPGSLINSRTYTVEHHLPIAPVPAWLADLLALTPRRPGTDHPPPRRRPGCETPEVTGPPRGWCEPHWRDPDDEHTDVPLAAYVWTSQNGTETELCALCNTSWRQGLREDPGLERPLRIRPLTGPAIPRRKRQPS